MANASGKIGNLALLLLLSGALIGTKSLPMDEVKHAPQEDLIAEARAQKQDQNALEMEEDLDGRSAYVNNQYVPSEPIEMIDDEQNAPLYEILQKQMEQVLAATGPDVPIYEDDKSKRQRNEQLPNKPLFANNNEAEAEDDYVDEASSAETEQGYVDAEKPDASVVDEQAPEGDYQIPQLSTTEKPQTSSSSSTSSTSTSSTTTTTTTTTRSRPQRRRSTTAMPRTTRSKNHSPTKLTATTPSSLNHVELISTTSAPPVSAFNQKQRPHNNSIPSHKATPSQSNSSNALPHDPQIYQHKRRIIFKTISTGSQFVNSPIGDLMIKFSIGFAKPAPGVATPTSEALRAFSNNLLQKLKRNRLQKD